MLIVSQHLETNLKQLCLRLNFRIRCIAEVDMILYVNKLMQESNINDITKMLQLI